MYYMYHCEQRERVFARGGSYRCALNLISPPSAFREEVFSVKPLLKEAKRVSPRCTRKRIAYRVRSSGYYSSTLSTGSRTRSECRGCSKNSNASLRRAKKHWAQLTLILTLLLVVGVTAVLLSSTVIFSDPGSATNATVEDVPFSSKSSISELPRTGGP
jgi:hypothetical protein